MPTLPLNAIEASTGSTEGDLRAKLTEAEQRLKRYEQAYGKEGRGLDDRTPLSVITDALGEASEGMLPGNLIEQAEIAARELRVTDFLIVIRRIMERGIRLSDRQFLTLANIGTNIGLHDVVGAVFDHAIQLHPRSRDLRRSHFAHTSHSPDPAIRARARQEIMKELNIRVDDNGNIIEFPLLDQETAGLLGVMQDAYITDELYKEALAITTAALKDNAQLSIVLRNHARALDTVDQTESLSYYRQAILAEDADEISMEWFGNELHNKDQHVDAAEVYLLSCLIDADDAAGFAHVALEIALATKKLQSPKRASKQARHFPPTVNLQTVETAISAASSCGDIDYRDIERMRTVAGLLSLNLNEIASRRIGINERVAFASKLYDELASELTNPALGQGKMPIKDA